MKKLLGLVVALVMVVSCGPFPRDFGHVIIDNRTPAKFQVYVDDYARGTLDPGAMVRFSTIKGRDYNVQLRYWTNEIEPTLVIVSFPIGFQLSKVFITLDEEGELKIEFVGWAEALDGYENIKRR